MKIYKINDKKTIILSKKNGYVLFLNLFKYVNEVNCLEYRGVTGKIKTI